MTFELFPTPAIIAQIGPLKLHFYGAMYALSAVLGYFLLCFLSAKKNLSLQKDQILDFIFWTFLGGILGGRLFYTLVYNFSYFAANLSDIFAVWKGGMSIHGGLLGGAIAAIWFIKKKKLPLWEIAGIVVPALALGMMLGRIGNFVNGELCGRMTDVSWAIECGGNMVHPSQLYAVGKDFLLFGIFLLLNLKTNIHGKTLFGMFLCGYGSFRFFVEFFRAPDPQIGLFWEVLSMGQILSLFVIFIGGFLLYRREKVVSSNVVSSK